MTFRVGHWRAIGLWLIGLPPLIYLLAAAWLELDLPYPKVWGTYWTEGYPNGSRQYPWPGVPTFFTFDGYSKDLVYPLDASFRKLMAPLTLISLLAGPAAGLLRPSLRSMALLGTSGLVVLAYLAFLTWNGWSNVADCGYQLCYRPGKLLQELGVHNWGHGARSFLITVEVMGIIALFVILGIWSGVATTKLGRLLHVWLKRKQSGN